MCSYLCQSIPHTCIQYNSAQATQEQSGPEKSSPIENTNTEPAKSSQIQDTDTDPVRSSPIQTTDTDPGPSRPTQSTGRDPGPSAPIPPTNPSNMEDDTQMQPPAPRSTKARRTKKPIIRTRSVKQSMRAGQAFQSLSVDGEYRILTRAATLRRAFYVSLLMPNTLMCVQAERDLRPASRYYLHMPVASYRRRLPLGGTVRGRINGNRLSWRRRVTPSTILM